MLRIKIPKDGIHRFEKHLVHIQGTIVDCRRVTFEAKKISLKYIELIKKKNDKAKVVNEERA